MTVLPQKNCYFSFLKVQTGRERLPWQREAEVPAMFVGTLTPGFSERGVQPFSCTLEQQEPRVG